ncbi:hypothetical protein IEQ34_008269 [Dendrobium chrysotoxum]|uniref:Uncharacterized protein n=1 Tax=Dendrobium chrysotoxum TaxID=161865 RepID=A0AAV7H5N8_DENCH|nr:hypothetical protein IEQ34_008269 [Dendrobium chrysotoxum]
MEMSKKKSSCVRGPEKAEGARLGAGRRNLELRFTGIVNGSIELISARGREDGSARCRGMGTVNAAVLSAISAGGRDFDRYRKQMIWNNIMRYNL